MNSAVAAKIEQFFQAYKQQHFDKGYILIYAGHEPPGVFYLESGQVREYDITTGGDEVVVNVFKPPVFFPMGWAINKAPNQYFFEVSAKTSLRMAPAEATVEFLKANPDVAFDLLSRLYSGTDGMLRRMAHLMGGDARTRLIYELMIECRRFGQRQADGSYLVDINEGELAKRAGLSRETVSRQLAGLDKLVTISRQGVYIKDLEKLEASLGDQL